MNTHYIRILIDNIGHIIAGGVLCYFRGGFGISDSGLEDTVFNGIRVKYSSGNIAQGTVSLYGRKI